MKLRWYISKEPRTSASIKSGNWWLTLQIEDADGNFLDIDEEWEPIK